MTKEELGNLDMGFIRALGATNPEMIMAGVKNGKLVEFTKEETRIFSEKKRMEVRDFLKTHYSSLLSSMGLSADNFDKGLIYIPSPVILKFKNPDGSVVDVDYYEQLFNIRFKEYL